MAKMKNILFKNGKNALLAGLDYLEVKEKSGILMPKFVCNDLPLELKNKYNIFFYDLDNYLNPKVEKIKKINLKKKNIKVLIFIHYFGYYFNIDQIKNFCKKKKIILVEDNSHGFGSGYKGKLIGTKSDFSFSSPHKTINNINSGGNLMIKKFSNNLKKFEKDNSLKRRLFNYFLFLKKINFIKKLKYSYNNLEDKDLKELKLIDDYNKEKLRKIKLTKIKNEKLKKYNFILNKFSNLKLNFHYFNFDKSTIPWFFAIIIKIKDIKNVNKVIGKNNFDKVNWPNELPVEVSNNESIKKLRKKIILIKL